MGLCLATMQLSCHPEAVSIKICHLPGHQYSDDLVLKPPFLWQHVSKKHSLTSSRHHMIPFVDLMGRCMYLALYGWKILTSNSQTRGYLPLKWENVIIFSLFLTKSCDEGGKIKLNHHFVAYYVWLTSMEHTNSRQKVER